MELVQAKCTNCGANIQIDPNTEAGVCPYCHTAYITQKAIVNYNTTVINNNTIHADTVNIVGGDFNNLMKLGRESWEGQDFEGAYQSFTKALEIDPDSEEAALYRCLCLGWKERETNYSMILNTYHRVFDKVDFGTADEEQCDRLNYFIVQFEALNFSTTNMKFKQYDPDLYDTTENIQYVWRALEEGISVQEEILDFAVKIKDKDDRYKNNYVNYMKRLLNYYQTICMKWKYLMPIDHRYHSSVYHPSRGMYLQKMAELEENIQKDAPDFTGGQAKKMLSRASSKIPFILSCVLTGLAIVFYIVQLWLAGSERVDLFSMLVVSQKYFSITIVTMVLGLVALVVNIVILIKYTVTNKIMKILTIVFLIGSACIGIASLVTMIECLGGEIMSMSAIAFGR